MKIKIIWMYHTLMDLYGDKGNIEVLKTRCQKRGIDCIVDTCAIGEDKNIDDYDLFFLGGGADKEQNMIFSDLIQRKESILEAMNHNTAFLLICGGYQLFGQYYKDQDGNIVDGLGFFDYYTESSDRDHRCIGDIAVETTMDGDTFQVVGFENHGGQTKDVNQPFARVLKGHGNIYKGEYEGFMNDTVLATYMHGPLLPKNPMVADKIILRALNKRHKVDSLESINDDLENKAREVMLKRLLK
ncbi:MAG: glutamine amidotransferase [Solobacterium sp.]|nr:glutamine amidotransferase [Solobacterium sp.]